MYVDESGDSGLVGSPGRYFVLTGVVVHELRWTPYLEQLIDFRRRMKATFGLKLADEIHSSAMINHPGDLVRIKRNDRLTILRSFTNELATMTDLNIINVVVDKSNKPADYDVFTMAWRALIQRFENTMARRNFVGPANADERGILLPDNTDNKKLTQLLRQLRRYNPIPNQPVHGVGYRNLLIQSIIEDPSFKNSADSYFIQAADLIAFLLYQQISPGSYMRKKSGQHYFARLNHILCKVAAPRDPQGIVRLYARRRGRVTPPGDSYYPDWPRFRAMYIVPCVTRITMTASDSEILNIWADNKHHPIHYLPQPSGRYHASRPCSPMRWACLKGA